MFLEKLKKSANVTYTENGAIAYQSTLSHCLDLFATIGALRNRDDADVVEMFMRAWAEDANIATRIAFFARDVRGGLGERKVFRTIFKYLADHHPATAKKNIANIAEYGRYDDMLVLLGTKCEDALVSFIAGQIKRDLTSCGKNEPVSLLAKWLPSINASNATTVHNARTLAKRLGMSEREYRKMLSKLRRQIDIIENYLRSMEYTFDYSKQPSRAMLKYTNAFQRNDSERYTQFLESVKNGDATLHTGTLFPYDIVYRVMHSGENDAALDVTWNALEDFTRNENAIVVVDGSGSMYLHFSSNPEPASVAISLAIYYAERNKGAFHNHFITFSHTPRLVEIKGNNITEKVQYCQSFNECANTNLSATFDLILKTAVANHCAQEELPSTMYIVSDMEFDVAATNPDKSVFEDAKLKFENAGYALPNIVFWNVDSRNEQQPVTMNEYGVTLVSGYSARIFQMITEKTTPMQFMLKTLESDRYKNIFA